MTHDPAPGDAVGAADAVGAPLSELSRILMRHEPALEVTVPGWVADEVACRARRWGVAAEVAGAWLLAVGVAQLVHAADADLLDGLVEKIPGLDITADDDSADCRLVVQTPGAELFVALDRLANLTGAETRHVAAVAVLWGAERLHDTDDHHVCAAGGDDDDAAGAETSGGDHQALDAHEAAVLAEAPIEALALGLLAPKQFLAVSLPTFAEDWLGCIARRWRSTESVTAAWLLAEGAGYLLAMELRDDTAWRAGPSRWVLPPEHPNGPRRLIETPGEQLQATLGRLAVCRGDDPNGIAALAVAVGAKMWLDDHGCSCDAAHRPGAGAARRVDAGALSEAERQSLRRLRLRWMRLRWPRPRPDQDP